MQSFELLAKILPPRHQITDLSHYNWLVGSYIQNPIIVFYPGAALSLDHTHYAEWLCNLAIIGGQETPIDASCLFRAWPWHALRARRIIEMDVRVDDWKRIFLGLSIRHTGANGRRPHGSRRLYKIASIHFGFPLAPYTEPHPGFPADILRQAYRTTGILPRWGGTENDRQ